MHQQWALPRSDILGHERRRRRIGHTRDLLLITKYVFLLLHISFASESNYISFLEGENFLGMREEQKFSLIDWTIRRKKLFFLEEEKKIFADLHTTIFFLRQNRRSLTREKGEIRIEQKIMSAPESQSFSLPFKTRVVGENLSNHKIMQREIVGTNCWLCVVFSNIFRFHWYHGFLSREMPIFFFVRFSCLEKPRSLFTFPSSTFTLLSLSRSPLRPTTSE